MQILPETAHAFDLKYYGTYEGVQLSVAARGGSFGDSTMTLHLDEKGLTLGARLPGDAREWKIVYTPEWLVPGLNPLPCLRIRQGPLALGYAYQFCFEGSASRRVRVRMSTIDEVALGEFTRVEAREKKSAVRVRLNRIYRVNHASPLLGINWATNLLHQGRAATAEKLDLLAEIRRAFVTYNDEQLEHFEPLLAHALKDPAAEVRLAALKVFARMPTASSVDDLLDLSRRADLTPELAERLTLTLGLYLETVNQILMRREALIARYGDDDLETAHQKTRGVIFARDLAQTDLMIFLPRSRAWSIEQRDLLRAQLNTIALRGSSQDARLLAADVLRVRDPFATCEGTLAHRWPASFD